MVKIASRGKSGKLLRRVWGAFGLAIIFSVISCSDTGVLAAIEDAKKLKDGNLNNSLFAHSLVQIKKTVYVGSKLVWQKSSSNGEWKEVDLPDGLDPNETSVVSIATDGEKLFLASNKKLYVRDDKKWSAGWPDSASTGFSFYALRGVAGTVLAVDWQAKIYRYKDGTWHSLGKLEYGMNDFVKIDNKYYLASGNELKVSDTADFKTTADFEKMESHPENGKEIITNLLAVKVRVKVEEKEKKYLCLLAGAKLYIYDIQENKWESPSENLAVNISLGQVDDKLIVGHSGGGYRIYDFVTKEWQDPKSDGGFTDKDSLVTLASGASILNLKLGIFLFYDDDDDKNNDRIYAATASRDGVFSAKRTTDGWSWGLE